MLTDRIMLRECVHATTCCIEDRDAYITALVHAEIERSTSTRWIRQNDRIKCFDLCEVLLNIACRERKEFRPATAITVGVVRHDRNEKSRRVFDWDRQRVRV